MTGGNYFALGCFIGFFLWPIYFCIADGLDHLRRLRRERSKPGEYGPASAFECRDD